MWLNWTSSLCLCFFLKGLKNQVQVKMNIVSCPPVTTVLIKRPDLKYQLGFSVQNGIVSRTLIVKVAFPVVMFAKKSESTIKNHVLLTLMFGVVYTYGVIYAIYIVCLVLCMILSDWRLICSLFYLLRVGYTSTVVINCCYSSNKIHIIQSLFKNNPIIFSKHVMCSLSVWHYLVSINFLSAPPSLHLH